MEDRHCDRIVLGYGVMINMCPASLEVATEKLEAMCSSQFLNCTYTSSSLNTRTSDHGKYITAAQLTQVFPCPRSSKSALTEEQFRTKE